jgi:hypothetical protein
MALFNLTRIDATVPHNGSYQPNCLLGACAFALTLQGSATILPPVSIADGTIMLVRINFSALAGNVATWDPAYGLTSWGVQQLIGYTRSSMLWLFGYESGRCHKIASFGL